MADSLVIGNFKGYDVTQTLYDEDAADEARNKDILRQMEREGKLRKLL